MLSLLTECTIQMLRIIHEMYREQRITFEEFYNHTKVKVEFLSNNMNHLSSIEKKIANEVIDSCIALINQNNNENMFYVYRNDADVLQ